MSSADILKAYGFKSVEEAEDTSRDRNKALLDNLKRDGVLRTLVDAQSQDIRDNQEFFAKHCLGNGVVEGSPSGIGLQSTGTCYVYAALVAILNCGNLAGRIKKELLERNDFRNNPLAKSGQQRSIKAVIHKLFEDKVSSKNVDRFIEVMSKSEEKHRIVRDMLLVAVLTLAKGNGEKEQASVGQDAMYALLTSRFSDRCSRGAIDFLRSVQGGKPLDVIQHVVGMFGVADYPLHRMKMYPDTDAHASAILVVKEGFNVLDATFEQTDLTDPEDIMFDQSGVFSIYTKTSGHAVAYARDVDGSMSVFDANFKDPVPVADYPIRPYSRVSLSLSPCVTVGAGQIYANPASGVGSRYVPVRAQMTVNAARQLGDMSELYVLESLLYILMLEPYYDGLEGTYLADELADWFGYAQQGGASRTPWGAWAAMSAVVMAGSLF